MRTRACEDGVAMFGCLAMVWVVGLFIICAGAISIALLLHSPMRRRAFVVIPESFSESATPTPVPEEPLPTLRPGVATVGVMVENHVDARPQVGLDSAALVYEAPAEGGITRYLAIFSFGNLPPKIGPVRSVRPYFIDWAEEWGATLFHSGGSPEALARLKKSALPNLDEISYNGRYFWRDESRLRPHNLFTSGVLITQAFADYHLLTMFDAVRWASVVEAPISQRPADHPVMRIEALDSDYCVGYWYEQVNNRYARWLGGVPHRTADGAQLYAKTVVVQEVFGQVLDREGRLKISTDAGGKAIVFSNGQSHLGHWERNQSRTVFNDETGNPIGFPDGPIWIMITLDFDAVQVFSSITTPATPNILGCD